MLVMVTEIGPDGVQNVIWDTDKLREMVSFEDDWGIDTEEGVFDCVEFAHALETADSLSGGRYSVSYNLGSDEAIGKAISKEKKFDRELICYCED